MTHTTKTLAQEFEVNERSIRRYISQTESQLGRTITRRAGRERFIPDEYVELVRNVARGFAPDYKPPANPIKAITISPPAHLSLVQKAASKESPREFTFPQEESPREEFHPELEHLSRTLRSASPTVEKTPTRILPPARPTPEGIPLEMGLMIQRKTSQKALLEWGAIAGLMVFSLAGLWYIALILQPKPLILKSIPASPTYTPKIRDTGF
jgi:hypothetical protein